MAVEKRFLPLLNLEADQIKAKVLVCGDPSRAAKIAAKLDRAEKISCNREYVVFNGEKNGIKMTVASHGVGASGAAVCFEEVIKGGAKEIIRVGTAGSLRRDITDGDIVLATAAVREDGMTDQLIPAAYPAVSGYELLGKLKKASAELHIPTYSGMVLTLAAFYPELQELPNKQYSKAHVIAVEMEVSALFVISSLHGVQAGAVLAIDGMAIDFDADSYNPRRDLVDTAVEKEIELAIRALT